MGNLDDLNLGSYKVKVKVVVVVVGKKKEKKFIVVGPQNESFSNGQSMWRLGS